MNKVSLQEITERENNFSNRITLLYPCLPQGSTIEGIFSQRLNYKDIHGSDRTIAFKLPSSHTRYKPYPTLGYDHQGDFIVNTSQLLKILDNFEDINVRVLNLGSLRLEKYQLIHNLEIHDNLCNIQITCIDDILIIDNPEHL